MDLLEKLSALSLSEKARLVGGRSSWYTHAVPRLNIKSLFLTDGPLGVRVKKGKYGSGSMGLGCAVPSTAFPSPENLSATWDRSLSRRVGEAIGAEAAALLVDVLLAPGVNIKRDPRLGRSFEYLSEDPLLAGELCSEYILGANSRGISVALKHFALNNSEDYRYCGDSICDERAKREIYLSPFERVIKKAHPDTVMCAYNKIDGEYCSESRRLLTHILRDEWGFDGLVMTDWGATHDRVRGILAGCDLDMPGGVRENTKKILRALKSGEMKKEALDKCVHRILRLEEKHNKKKNGNIADLYDSHAALALEVAKRSAVLLENDGTLPLSREGEYVVIGELFEHMRYQGNGSSRLSPARHVSPLEAFDEAGINYKYAPGYLESETEPCESLENEALELIDENSTVIAFLGLCDISECEGVDRRDIRLAENQLSLIEKIKKKARKTVIVLFGGSPVETDFCHGANAVLNMFLPGEMGGSATLSLLFGECSPCGHLSETWPERLEDAPAYPYFNKAKNALYKESIFVGYRYYSTAGVQPKYPFGYGLSYTSFDFDGEATLLGDLISVNATIKNSGDYDSYATLQVYSERNEGSRVFKPLRELRCFDTVFLSRGEEKRVTLTFNKSDLSYYNINEGTVLENGRYPIVISLDGKDFKSIGEIEISGERDVPCPYGEEVATAYENIGRSEISDGTFEKLTGYPIPEDKEEEPFTLESTLEEMGDTFIGKRIKRLCDTYVSHTRRRLRRMPRCHQRDELYSGCAFVENMFMKNSLRSLVQSSGGTVQMPLARFILKMANLSRKNKGK